MDNWRRRFATMRKNPASCSQLNSKKTMIGPAAFALRRWRIFLLGSVAALAIVAIALAIALVSQTPDTVVGPPGESGPRGPPGFPVTASCTFGTATFFTLDPAEWYPVLTDTIPILATLTLNRNGGFVVGNMALNPTGITINEAGNYGITYTAVFNQDPGSPDPLLVLTFLLQNGLVDFTNPDLPAVTVIPNSDPSVETTVSTGFIVDVPAGTMLTIGVANGGQGPRIIHIINWSIRATKLC